MVTEREAQYTETEDYYEILQLDPGADQDAIERSYKGLAKQYHPDNHETGDSEKFMQIVRAYETLSNTESRVAYDRAAESAGTNSLALITDADTHSYEGDQQQFDRILTLLYTSRRKNLRRSGLGVFHLEEMMGTTEDLEFHLWYLREKGYIERLENGLFSITAAGVDRIIEVQSRLARRRRRAQRQR